MAATLPPPRPTPKRQSAESAITVSDMSNLNRRTFLLGAAGFAGAGSVLAACGDDESDGADNSLNQQSTSDVTDTTPGSDASDDTAAQLFLVATFPDGFRAPSPFVHSVEQRIAYVLRDADDILRADAPAEATIEILFDDEVIAGGVLAKRDVDVPTPYYSVNFTPEEPGTYVSRLTYDEGTYEHEFLVLKPDETSIPQPGDVLPSVATATTDDLMGIDPLCTRLEPCPFHATNLVDALDAGDKPIVLSIATPGFCQTAVCGPVIDLLIDRAADRDDLHIIHAEVYVDPNNDDGVFTGQAETTEIIGAYVLPYEPVLYVVAADGTILRRLDAIYDGSELDEALALV